MGKTVWIRSKKRSATPSRRAMPRTAPFARRSIARPSPRSNARLQAQPELTVETAIKRRRTCRRRSPASNPSILPAAPALPVQPGEAPAGFRSPSRDRARRRRRRVEAPCGCARRSGRSARWPPRSGRTLDAAVVETSAGRRIARTAASPTRSALGRRSTATAAPPRSRRTERRVRAAAPAVRGDLSRRHAALRRARSAAGGPIDRA